MDEETAGNSTQVLDSLLLEANESHIDHSPKCVVSIKKSLLSPSFCSNYSREVERDIKIDSQCISSQKDIQFDDHVSELIHSLTATTVVPSNKTRQHMRRKSLRLFRLSKQPYCSQTDFCSVINSPGPSCCNPKAESCSQPSSTESGLEIRRHLRKIKRKSHSDESCPVCGVTVRSPELQSHFEQEVKRLDTIHRNLKKKTIERCCANKTYKQVKSNREDRVKIPFKRGNIEMKCPGCLQNLTGHFESILLHISDCIKQEDEDNLFEENYDVDYDSSHEYTWGDDVRVRSISLLDSVSDIPADLIQKTEENDIVDIIDSDDAPYGPSQYSERDVIPSLSTAGDLSRSALRAAVISVIEESAIEENSSLVVEACNTNQVDEKSKHDSSDSNDNECDVKKDISDSSIEDSDIKDSVSKNLTPESLLIESLTRRIKELENLNNDEIVKCHVCIGSYQEPLVSTTCWHVHCNDCWMKLLGEKKLCPQCSTITLPCNLRRVYI